MIELYQMEMCPFCAKVRRAMEDLEISYISHPATMGTKQHEKLLEMTGRGTVPYIVDNETGTAMHESEDIIKYLKQTYGN